MLKKAITPVRKPQVSLVWSNDRLKQQFGTEQINSLLEKGVTRKNLERMAAAKPESIIESKPFF